jgi:hypothetical protein
MTIKVKILGYGEIGKSIHRVYDLSKSKWEVAYKDLKLFSGCQQCDVLNVTIPYSEEFVDIVCNEIKESKCSWCIIHSTVAPGTTAKIQEQFEFQCPSVNVIHSPIIGVHPNLTIGILTFPKWIGYQGRNTELELSYIIDHFKRMGITNLRFASPCEATEVFKLLDTTYYGMCLTFNAEAEEWLNKISENSKVPLYPVWVEYLKCYNHGYEILGMGNVVRPYFNKLSMPIGGHCVVPNTKILKQYHPFPALEQILKYTPNES